MKINELSENFQPSYKFIYDYSNSIGKLGCNENTCEGYNTCAITSSGYILTML